MKVIVVILFLISIYFIKNNNNECWFSDDLSDDYMSAGVPACKDGDLWMPKNYSF